MDIIRAQTKISARSAHVSVEHSVHDSMAKTSIRFITMTVI
jgi:hypothetical protein